MNASQPSSSSASPEPSSPSNPMLTMVGLGPPLREEPLLAGTTAYAEEDSAAPPSQERTLVGFPGAPAPNLYDATELYDAPHDAITTVMNYDEITVVTRIPILAEARATPSEPPAAVESPGADAPPAEDMSLVADRPLVAGAPLVAETSLVPDEQLTADASPSAAPSPVDSASLADEADAAEGPPDVPSFIDSALPLDSSAKPEDVAHAGASELVEPEPELVEPEPELRIFPPSLDSLVPPRRTFDIPLVTPSAKPATTSEAPWFVSVETPKRAPFPRARHIVLLALVVGAVALGAIALRPSTGQVLVTVGGPQDVAVTGAVVYVDGERACAPAPCRVTVPIGSRLIGVGAPSYRRPADKALAVRRGSEEALHFTLLPQERAGIETPPPARTPVAAEAPKAPPLPTAEVVSVNDLRVRPEAVKPSFGVQPATVSAPSLPHPIDLDRPAESALAGSKLTITSTPPCNVVLDGRPLGMTPHEVTVSPGAHSVVFIHPTEGRKSVRIEAVSGKAAVATVSF